MIGSDLLQMILFGILAGWALFFAKKKGYFNALRNPVWVVPIQWFHVLGVFGLYFAFGFLIFPFLFRFFVPHFLPLVSQKEQVGALTWLNFLNGCVILYSIFILSPPHFQAIWNKTGRKWSLGLDLKAMIYTLLLAFPVIFFCNAFFELIIHGVFHLENLPDQIAVQWLKASFDFPFYFFLTSFTIVVIAPLLEETLFRGYLQSFLRKYLGAKVAIPITAFCFACFHFSPEQGWNNLPIIASLFPLALFLGYLYEKQGSLFASISMHATFNGISLMNIYLFGDSL